MGNLLNLGPFAHKSDEEIKTFLLRVYIVEGRSTEEIAPMIGYRSATTVKNLMEKLRIPRRSAQQHFIKNRGYANAPGVQEKRAKTNSKRFKTNLDRYETMLATAFPGATPQVPVSRWVLDFLIGNLNIEVDGRSHANGPRKKRDDIRNSQLVSLGYSVVRITHRAIDEDWPFLVEVLHQMIANPNILGSKPTSIGQVEVIRCRGHFHTAVSNGHSESTVLSFYTLTDWLCNPRAKKNRGTTPYFTDGHDPFGC